MEFFIKKIKDSGIDEMVHLQFKKYSRGEFKNKAMITAKRSKDNYAINTSPEYANELVRFFGESLGDNSAKVNGIIVSTRDLTGELDFQDKKQFMGVKQYIINKEMNGREIVELCNKLPNSFIGLSFNANGSELKIKPKAPKSAKPSVKTEEKTRVDFCKLKTDNKELVKSLLFDVDLDHFKNAEITHDFIINDIIVSDELKKQANGDYSLMKEMAKRKGKIVRKVKTDYDEKVSEIEFEA